MPRHVQKGTQRIKLGQLPFKKWIFCFKLGEEPKFSLKGRHKKLQN